MARYSESFWSEPVTAGPHSWIEPVFPVYSGAAMSAVADLGTTVPQLQFLIGLKNKTEATTGHTNIVFRHELRLGGGTFPIGYTEGAPIGLCNLENTVYVQQSISNVAIPNVSHILVYAKVEEHGLQPFKGTV
jgi:hypothetical protein